ncbi:TRAP transporter small permease protein [Betaproteobacteria bacterium]|nr:TRAP transporter small permease protein [Betaproteobacteria bacterium]
MKKLLSSLQKIENCILVVALVVMVISVFAQVLNRNFIHATIGWYEELARYCQVYMALLAAEAGLRDGTQISVTAFTEKLPAPLQTAAAIGARLVVIIFAAVCFFTSFRILGTQISSNQVSAGLQIPMLIPYLSLPLGFGIIVAVQTVQTFMLISPTGGSKE